MSFRLRPPGLLSIIRLAAISCLAAACIGRPAALAHEGHDHDDAATTALAASTYPRVVAQSELYEIVGVRKKDRLDDLPRPALLERTGRRSEAEGYGWRRRTRRCGSLRERRLHVAASSLERRRSDRGRLQHQCKWRRRPPGRHAHADTGFGRSNSFGFSEPVGWGGSRQSHHLSAIRSCSACSYSRSAFCLANFVAGASLCRRWRRELRRSCRSGSLWRLR